MRCPAETLGEGKGERTAGKGRWTARPLAFCALTQLREQGVIKTWGLSQHTVEPCEPALNMAEARPARFPLAGRYTLLDYESALERLTVTQRVVNHRAEPRLQGLPAGQESALFNYGKQ